MRWRKMLLAFGWIVMLPGCGKLSEHLDETTEDELVPDPEPARCPGICVHTAPAAFTGPSEFSIAPADLVQRCPAGTPFEGVEGIVTSPYPMWFARECHITPTDGCASEGLTCVPLPTEDFQVCIHHDGDRPCPANAYEYTERTVMLEDPIAAPITLCCMPRVWKG